MAVRVEYDYDAVKEATRYSENIVQRIYAKRRYQIAEAFIDVVTPFVPVKSGELRRSASITDDGYSVTWSATNPRNGYDYSGIQYDIPMNHPKGGSDHWDREAMFYAGDLWLKKCEEILNK